MRAFYLLCRMRALEVLRNRASVGFFLGLPLLLLVALGTMFADGHPFERKQVALVAGPHSAEQAQSIRSALAAYPEVHLTLLPDRQMALGQLRGHMLESVLVLGEPGDASPGLRIYAGKRGRLLATALAGVLAQGEAPPPIETIPTPRFGYVHHLFSGLLAFSILTAGLLGMGSALARYRQNQLLKKLALTPLRQSTFVAAQLVARSLLGLLQVVVLIVAGRLLFALPISWAGALWLLGVSGFGLLTFMGLGFLVATLIRSEGLLLEVVSALMTPLVLLSEMFFPLSELPRPLLWLGEALPSTQLVRLLRLGIDLDGSLSSPMLVAPCVSILALWLGVGYLAAVRSFKSRWLD